MSFQIDKHSRNGAPDRSAADDAQIGPDEAEWPGEQARRMNDDYRSWRHDRYRESSDQSPRGRHPQRQT